MSELNLADADLKGIVASGALSSSSWSEVMLKLSIVGIELTYDVFLLFLACILFVSANEIHDLMLNELKTSDSLDAFFSNVNTLCLIYDMKCNRHQAFDFNVWKKFYDAYADSNILNKQILSVNEENDMLARRTSAFFTICTKKFPKTIWLFYCKNKQLLWKNELKFCTTLQHYFSKRAEANDTRCNFCKMADTISNDRYAMTMQNAFMN